MYALIHVLVYFFCLFYLHYLPICNCCICSIYMLMLSVVYLLFCDLLSINKLTTLLIDLLFNFLLNFFAMYLQHTHTISETLSKLSVSLSKHPFPIGLRSLRARLSWLLTCAAEALVVQAPDELSAEVAPAQLRLAAGLEVMSPSRFTRQPVRVLQTHALPHHPHHLLFAPPF